MLVPVLLFLLGLLLLIKGGDWFVDGATGIARRFHIPEIIVGATVVSIGTTLPEVMVSSASAVKGAGGIAYGNAIGSVICNTALIAALTVAVKPGPVDRKSLKTPVIFFFGSAVFYLFNAYVFGRFDRWAGIVLLSVFLIYMIITVRQGLSGRELPAEEGEAEIEPARRKPLWQDLLLLVVGAAFIAVGADLLVDNGTIIAEKLGVPQSVIA